MDYNDVLEYSKSIALLGAVERTEEAIYRSVCRSYSKKFHTPLHTVFTLDPVQVATAFFEDQMDNMDIEESLDSVLDSIYTLQDPDYQSEKVDELKDFMEEAEAEEEARVKAGKPIHKDLKEENNPLSDKKPEMLKKPIKPLPTSGGINMDYFNEDNER